MASFPVDTPIDLDAPSRVGSVTFALALFGLMITLAVLDLIGAVFAKEWTIGRNPLFFVAGALSFVALFAVYAIGLRHAELTTVTFGWIVGLQVSILVIDRVRYGVVLPTGKWVAVAAILVLQAYLVLGGGGSTPDDARSNSAP